MTPLAGLVLAAASVCLFPAGCRDKQEKPAVKAVSVSATKSVCKDMPIEFRTFGTVEAYATVSVRSMVTGELRKVHINPGQYVDGPRNGKPGTPLFTIDLRPFQAAFDKAKADLESSQAGAKDARRRAEELKRLYEAKAGAYDEMRTAEAIADALEARVSANRAAVEQTSLDLDYATIESPIDGRAGDVLVKEGNLVKANDAVLVTITKIRPIYVTFSAPQSYLPPIRERMAKSDLEVLAEVKSPDRIERVDRGTLTFVNNAVDASTGTILLKATFNNASELLWPGQFVNVTLILGSQPGAVVVPAQAVQVGQQGQYVYVVGPDKKVQPRFVTVDRNVGEEAVISSGLEAGLTVVADGQLKLSPGALVKIEQPTAGPATATGPVEGPPIPASKPAVTNLPDADRLKTSATRPVADSIRPDAASGRPDVADFPASQPAAASRPPPVNPTPVAPPPASRPARDDGRKPLDNDDPPRPEIRQPMTRPAG
ncbi:MAG: efflux RND transporter periplasmic adaptor subunit [Planctomycetes bacterium]|nr:efflux RND transporter periplasmic adaptor subunit [Planctomycetota bacterium]